MRSRTSGLRVAHARCGALLTTMVTAFVAGGCANGDSQTTSPPPPTIQIINNSCAAGRCMSLDITAFVNDFTVPQSPLGLKHLGFFPPGQFCVSFPAQWTLNINGFPTLVWTPSSPNPIHLVAVDSAAWYGTPTTSLHDSISAGIPPYDGYWGPTVGETFDFYPGTSDGWTVVFPGTMVRADSVRPVPRCK